MNISAMILSWNTKDDTIKSIKSINKELEILKALGHKTNFVFTDQGSTDGIVEWVRHNGNYFGITHINFNPFNFGISIGRNIGLDMISDSDYIFMIDGDVNPVENTFKCMIDYMEQNKNVGCLGANSLQVSPNEQMATQRVESLVNVSDGHPGGLQQLGVAYTQYGCFRGSLFHQYNLRFEDNGPFALPGHGYEDDDMAIQISKLSGMKIKQFKDVYYYHLLYKHRSTEFLKKEHNTNSVDRATMRAERINYLIEKWSINMLVQVVPYLGGGCEWNKFLGTTNNVRPLDQFQLEVYNALKKYEFKSLFSIGFGSASVEYYLWKNDNKIIGMSDTGSNAILAAKNVFANSGFVISQCDGRQNPVPDKSYDMVYSCGLLEHFNNENDIIDFLKEKKRISKKYVISIVPSANCKSYIYGKYWAERTKKWEYGCELPKCSQKIYFRKAGLKVIDEFTIDNHTGYNFLHYVPEKYKHKVYEDSTGYLLVTVGKIDNTKIKKIQQKAIRII
ncbi:MAG: glycosyltransferase [bacterium]|nr:glycosyltransferase [bacterium]